MLRYNDVVESGDFILSKIDIGPLMGIIIGTGLERIIDSVEIKARINYEDIPGFVSTTVQKHAGVLVFGTLGGIDVVVMNGRFHYYEGYTMQEIVFPVYVMKELGVSYLLVSNAAGGINPEFREGTIVIVKDHINLMGDNPLIGPNDQRLGLRYPDMFNTYDPGLIRIAEESAEKLNIVAKKGVYAALSGPCLETPAEYRFLRTIGADVVGMSTVPEIIAGVHCGLKNCCLSVVTDECWPEVLKEADIEEIIKTATAASVPLCNITEEIARRLGEERV